MNSIRGKSGDRTSTTDDEQNVFGSEKNLHGTSPKDRPTGQSFLSFSGVEKIRPISGAIPGLLQFNLADFHFVAIHAANHGDFEIIVLTGFGQELPDFLIAIFIKLNEPLFVGKDAEPAAAAARHLHAQPAVYGGRFRFARPARGTGNIHQIAFYRGVAGKAGNAESKNADESKEKKENCSKKRGHRLPPYGIPGLANSAN
ncbi:MAG TPA: hypothetical protein VH724_18080 [Candidatus Angelobacter sp.]|nr:hypothetical protein [Candidatus Angelobacter sp.]